MQAAARAASPTIVSVRSRFPRVGKVRQLSAACMVVPRRQVVEVSEVIVTLRQPSRYRIAKRRTLVTAVTPVACVAAATRGAGARNLVETRPAPNGVWRDRTHRGSQPRRRGT